MHAAPCWSRLSLNGASCPDSGAHPPWFASRDTSKVLVDQRCCLRVCNMTPFRQFAVGARAAYRAAPVCLGARAACPQLTSKHATHRSSNIIMLSEQQDRRMPHLAGLAFPPTDHPVPIRVLTLPGSLAATPARCSLISSVACGFVI